jgi:hypothetical protein
MKTAFTLLGYCRRTSKKKGFSDEPRIYMDRYGFTQWTVTWDRARVLNQIFSDEV